MADRLTEAVEEYVKATILYRQSLRKEKTYNLMLLQRKHKIKKLPRIRKHIKGVR